MMRGQGAPGAPEAEEATMTTTTTVRTLSGYDLVLGCPIAVSDGIVYLLTTCCQASGKGGEHGVVCRACGWPVEDDYGWACLADEFATAYLARLHASWLTEGTPDVFALYTARLAQEVSA